MASTDLISQLLDGTVEQLDVPEHLLALADRIYDDIGLYLSDNLPGGRDWTFYSQGSGRLGTGVRPVGVEEWDIDAVAEADVAKEEIGKKELKDTVGEALGGYVLARADDEKLAPAGIEPGRRCWTLRYHGPFHVDVLPAVPNPEGAPSGIWITDRDLVRWQPSNPKGYAEWFERQMAREFLERRTELAKAAKVSIEDIPAWQVKTTLQRAVQVLKLHRNSFFAADPHSGPPSCVVTTLAALAYRGEPALADALFAAAADMPRFIDKDGEIWVVENPAQPGDNLADRWSSRPGALERFRPWLDDLQSTLDAARNTTTGMQAVVDMLSSRFDRSLVTKSMQNYAARQTSIRDAGGLIVTGAGALTTSGKGVPVRPHTFHGD